jgi:LytS/YehU family sensor histidine kinase
LAGGLQFGGFILLASIGHAVVYFRQFREREQRSLRLDQELTEARLTNLKSQLQPHFLFNSLNGISSHIHDDPEQAVDMVGHLGDLLRHSLDYAGDNDSLIRLSDEIEILDHYLELQSMRFGERLQISRDFAPETLGIEIPPFVLQPIAENVIRHAVETSPETRHLIIGSRLANDRLKLWIKDDGPGPDNDSLNPGSGTGLSNLRERLETTFPGDNRLDIGSGENGVGTVVIVELPTGGAT